MPRDPAAAISAWAWKMPPGIVPQGLQRLQQPGAPARGVVEEEAEQDPESALDQFGMVELDEDGRRPRAGPTPAFRQFASHVIEDEQQQSRQGGEQGGEIRRPTIDRSFGKPRQAPQDRQQRVESRQGAGGLLWPVFLQLKDHARPDTEGVRAPENSACDLHAGALQDGDRARQDTRSEPAHTPRILAVTAAMFSPVCSDLHRGRDGARLLARRMARRRLREAGRRRQRTDTR